MIRVVVTDDQALVRVGCRTLLEAEADIEVVGEAETGSAAVEVVRATCPEVMLMDIRMPEIDGLEATRRITADSTLAGVRILILTTSEIDEYVFDVDLPARRVRPRRALVVEPDDRTTRRPRNRECRGAAAQLRRNRGHARRSLRRRRGQPGRRSPRRRRPSCCAGTPTAAWSSPRRGLISASPSCST
jgi:chemotaxis response regulator CheB